MSVFNVISLLGGLGLFLYGMGTMGSGLEKLAGSKLEGILKRLTSNPIKGVVFGAVLTAAIQSSSATTVIVVGLVNSGIMQLHQAIGVIMGANIGTTVTAQILRLSDISSDNFFLQMLKPTTLAPIVCAIGAVLFMFAKSAKRRNLGQILLGFGVLFTGMFSMEAAVVPLRESETFIHLLSTLQNPILGVIVGAVFTAIIQSSSASVGILQALSTTGVVSWATALPIILGQNIGTCITPILASIGASKGAKRSAFVHLYFNIIGTTIFLIGIYSYKALVGIPFWLEPIGRGDIANFHTIFNVVVTLLFLPFTKVLARLAEWTIRTTKADAQGTPDVPVLEDRLLMSPALALQQAREAVICMADNARSNYSRAVPLLFSYNEKQVKQIEDAESVVDKLEVGISNYLIRMADKQLSEQESHTVSELLNLITEFERIGDYAINVVERAGEIYDKHIVFSEQARRELKLLDEAINEIIDLATQCFVKGDLDLADRVEPLEETIDSMCDVLRTTHIERLKKGICAIENGVVFLEILTNLERISDHCSNIAAHIIGRATKGEDFDAHELRRRLHEGNVEKYNSLQAEYRQKYYAPLGNN